MSIFGSFWKKEPPKPSKPDLFSSSWRDQWIVGYKFCDRYEIRTMLKGGMGVVYICYDHETKVDYALKTFKEEADDDFADKNDFFEKEVTVWINMGICPNIVRAYEAENFEGRLFIVLEYIAPDEIGRNTLTHYLGDLDLPRALNFSIQFCHGMEYAYSRGVDAHRDIKPDNIMITVDKVVKITDFGLAKAFQEVELKKDIISLDEKPGLSTFLNKGRVICGTLPYMAPEQFDGYADARSDVYSFGVTLYQMAAQGRPPFKGRNIEAYERMHKSGDIPCLSSRLFPVIQKCLAKRPQDRFQSFSRVREELEKLLKEETGQAIAASKKEDATPTDMFKKASSYEAIDKPNEAMACYDEALSFDPAYAEAWYRKGCLLNSLYKYYDALECLEKAIRLEPGSKLANFAETIKSCTLKEVEKIRPRHSECAEAWATQGDDFLKKYNNQEAVACCNEAIRLKPALAEAWITRGLGLYNLFGYRDEALVSFEEAIRLKPRAVRTAWWYKAHLLADDFGRYEEAIKCAEEAIRLYPGDESIKELKEEMFRNRP
ncbi:MAG: serine/threonine-protein kinase [Candidatus Omnitrophota bacterium]